MELARWRAEEKKKKTTRVPSQPYWVSETWCFIYIRARIHIYICSQGLGIRRDRMNVCNGDRFEVGYD